MRAGVSLFFQNAADWDRFEAAERGEDVPARPVRADADIWQEDLRLGHLVEELGFDTLWTVEHHVSPYTMITNPLQLLSYFAGALERVDLGSMIIVLPWHNPLRVAEDIVLLDNLLAGSGRTAKIGVGRGAGRREFNGLGIDMNESRPRFNESVEVIKLALTEDRFSYDGEIYTFDDVELRPKPRDGQALVDQLYCSAGSPQTIPIAAGYGLKPLIIPQKSFELYEEEMTQYAAVRAESGFAPAAPVMVMWMYCAETEDEARRGAEKYMPEYGDTALRNYELMSDHFKDVKGYEYYAENAKLLAQQRDAFGQSFIDSHIWGTPEQCLAKIESLVGSFHPEELVFVPRYGDMPAEVGEKSLRLFAKEVLPQVHAMPTLEPLVPAAS